MLIKLFIWIAVFYLGAKALIRWAAGPNGGKKEDSAVKGTPKHTEVPYNPEDIVDATFEEHTAEKKPTE